MLTKKKITVLGPLGEKFGHEFELRVASPFEAMRAIEANRPGFTKEADDSKYIIVMIDTETGIGGQITPQSTILGWENSKELFLIPLIYGEFGIGEAIIAAIISAGVGGGLLAGTTAGALSALGATLAVIINVVVAVAVSVAISAIAGLLTGGGGDTAGFTTNETEAPENTPSYIFNGAVNTQRQGHPIPVLYGGPMLVGSMVLSTGIRVNEEK